MHSIENPHYSASFWNKRQELQALKRQKPMFEQLMGLTRECMKNNPQLEGDVEGAIQCEAIHPMTMSDLNNFTFHTHPMGDIDYTSKVDIKTTSNKNKDWLLIGLATKRKVVAYHKSDGYSRKVAEF